MSDKNNHIIQKQVIDITLPNTNAAFDWELNKRQGFTAIVNDQLEKCFDEFDTAGNHFIIDKLDIDLGVFTSDNLQAEMPTRLYTELRKKIENKLDPLYNQTSGGITPEADGGEQTEDAGLFFNEQQGKLQALLFFLEKGYLPWWGSALADWDANWVQNLTQNETGDLKNFLLTNGGRTVQRIAVQFNDDFIHYLLRGMGVTANAKAAWEWLMKILKNREQEFAERPSDDTSFTGQKNVSIPGIRAKYWYGWIAHAIGNSTIPSLSNLFSNQQDFLIFIQLEFLKRPPGKMDAFSLDEVPAIWREELRALENQVLDNNRGEGIAAGQIKQEKDITKLQNKPVDSGASQTRENILSENEQKISSEPSLIEQSSNDVKKRKTKIEKETDALFVNDAGLVLLHPFLKQLFGNCGWLDKNNFLNDDTQTMAVYALHYLATGETEALEHELVFPKFLAGVPWELPLEPVEALNDLEKAACDQLLREVLTHWEPLHNTSPDGLRETYLQRNGKLEHIYSGWHLSIEYKTLDILLSRLPWGTSMIKFPWMPEMLTVTWQ